MNGDGVGLCHLDTLIHARLGFTDRTVALLLGHAFLSVIDRLGGGFLTQSRDITRLVADIGYVDVDQAQTDLFQLGFHVAADGGKELVAVGVDLLNVHGSDDQTKLTEDDILGQLLNFGKLQTQEALGGVLHNAGLGGNTYREARGNVNADVLTGKCIFEIHLNGNGRQIQIGVRLKHRNDKLGATVDALCTAVGSVLVFTNRTVNDHDLVRGAFFVPCADPDNERHHDKHKGCDQKDNFRGHVKVLL